MENTSRPFGQAGRVLALFTLFGAGIAVLHAQTAAPTLNLNTPEATTPAFSSSSSSDSDTAPSQVAANIEHLNFTGINAMQYGGRQRSGRPRYRGGNTNADGSEKYTFFGGVGLAAPVSDLQTYNTPSWAYGVGVGRNFNKHVGVQVEFNYDHFGLQGSTLANQSNLYNYYINQCNASPACVAAAGGTITQVTQLDGSSHDWSFGLTPTYQLYSGESMGAYALAGAGFYHKVTDFTEPEAGVGYDPYYGYYEYSANQIIDHYTSNAPGVDAGLGLTYKFSRFSNERFYVEARYVYTFNSYRPGITSATSPTALNAYTGANEYPANSIRSAYIPIKFGMRF